MAVIAAVLPSAGLSLSAGFNGAIQVIPGRAVTVPVRAATTTAFRHHAHHHVAIRQKPVQILNTRKWSNWTIL